MKLLFYIESLQNLKSQNVSVLEICEKDEGKFGRRMICAFAGAMVTGALDFFMINVDYSVRLRKEVIMKYADTDGDGFISDAEKRAVYGKIEKLVREYNKSE
jgi:hypothetical protein